MNGYQLTGYVYDLPRVHRSRLPALKEALKQIDGIRRVTSDRYTLTVEVAKGTKGRSLSDIFKEIELAYDTV